jgi:predicted membrane-bound spermidine synthase
MVRSIPPVPKMRVDRQWNPVGTLCASGFASVRYLLLDVPLGSENEMNVLTWALTMAVVLGVVGFVVGFFGPMIFMPNANQGPLAGLVWGPLGVVIGALVGCGIGLASRRRNR